MKMHETRIRGRMLSETKKSTKTKNGALFVTRKANHDEYYVEFISRA